jgi:hypothetical protein
MIGEQTAESRFFISHPIKETNFQSQEATGILNRPRGPTKVHVLTGSESKKTSNTELGIGCCQQNLGLHRIFEQLVILSSSVHKCRRFGRPTNNDAQCASLRYNQSFPFHQPKQSCVCINKTPLALTLISEFLIPF